MEIPPGYEAYLGEHGWEIRPQVGTGGYIPPASPEVGTIAIPGGTTYAPTPAPSQPSGGGTPDTYLEQLEKMDRNPSQEEEYQRLLKESQSFNQPVPQQPQIDFDALIKPALEALDQYLPILQSQYEANVGDIGASKQTQLAQSATDIAAQQQTLGASKTSQTQLAENAADEARRQFAEIQQGLQSRYGGTTGTGAFAAELVGRQTMQNIGKVRQGLSQAMQQIDMKVQQVQEIGRLAGQEIEDNARQLLNQAKASLDNAMAQIRMQKGELMARKAELAANAIQQYQNTVNNINAQNAAFKQNLYLQQVNAENQLKQAQQRASQIASNLPNASQYAVNPVTTPVTGGTTNGETQYLAGAGALDEFRRRNQLAGIA